MTDKSNSPSSTSGDSLGGSRKTGTVKWFNVAKGWGFITPDEKGVQDVFVHQSVIKMEGFRSLGENEKIEFECKETDKGYEATLVTGLQGLSCAGYTRPKRKIRCFNCGEFGDHIASDCQTGPQPKKCHYCKSVEHLIKDCPARLQDEDEHEQTASPQKEN